MDPYSTLIPAFLFCFAGILITAYWSIESIKAVSEKFNISETFVGAVFLSIGTSFPEFVNSLISGIQDSKTTDSKYAEYSFYNVTGANIWQIVFLVISLSIIAIIYWFKSKPEKLDEISDIFWKESFLSWQLVVLDTFLLSLIFLFPSFFSAFIIRGFSLLNLFFLFVWVWYLIHTYKNGSDSVKSDRVKYFLDWNKNVLIFFTIFLWFLFGAFAYGNFYISSKFPIDSSVSFGIILSFITSTPEFSALFYLFRKEDYRIAVGGFFGSSLFNLTLPCFTNFISLQPIFGKTNSQNKLAPWLILNLVLLFLFIISFLKLKKFRVPVVVLNGILIASIYITANCFKTFIA